jgi:hypothetical protein
MAMSNLCDVIGLRMSYGKADAQYETEFDAATGTIWGYSILAVRHASVPGCCATSACTTARSR